MHYLLFNNYLFVIFIILLMNRKFQYDIFHLKTKISRSWATNRNQESPLDISINKMFTHLGN